MAETRTLADEVGKRRWVGQHNPSGARASGHRELCKELRTARCGGIYVRREAQRRTEVNNGVGRENGRVGLNPIGSMEGSGPSVTAPVLEAVPWENSMYGILGGTAGNVV